MIILIDIVSSPGWKILVEDVEFLTGCELPKFWVLGWSAAPGIIAPFTVWWMTVVFIRDETWYDAPWPAISMLSTAVLAILIFIVFASVAVAKQVQYDFIGVRYYVNLPNIVFPNDVLAVSEFILILRDLLPTLM